MTEPTTSPAGAADAEDAYVAGDRPFRAGTARAALAHRDFRVVYFGAFASNIGSWMQNVVLAALAYQLTGSAVWVGLVIFAQLGPMMFISPLSGLLADALDRRRLLIAAQIEQMMLSFALAAITAGGPPNRAALLGVVFAIGVGQAINTTTWSAVVPTLVGRQDLAGAISLNSAQLNGSRVIGPAIGGLLFAAVGPSWVFSLNAVTYFFVIGALLAVRLPTIERASLRSGQRLHELLGGLRIARADPLVRRSLITISAFSLVALTFVGQMPVVAGRNYGIEEDSVAYGVLYALFGLGAVVGSIAVGSVWSAYSKARMVPRSLAAFAALLTPFALLSSPTAAFPLAFAVGLSYFVFITSLATVLQHALDDRVRGRVMALWTMGFGGTVPIGNLVAGPIIEATSIRAVMVVGAVAAVVLALYADLEEVGATV